MLESYTSKSSKNPLIFLFQKLWQYSNNHYIVVCFWVLFIIAGFVELLCVPFIYAKIVNTLQLQGVTSGNLYLLLLLLLFAGGTRLLFWSFHGPARVLETINAFKIRLNYRKHLLSGVITLPLEWHSEHHSGDTIDKVEKGTNALFSFSEISSFETIYASIDLIGSYVVLTYLSPFSAVVLLIMALLVFFVISRIDRILVQQYQELNHAENEISENVFDTISNITTVIILRVERLVLDSIIKKTEKPFDLFKKNIILNEIKWATTSFLCSVSSFLVLGMYFWQCTQSQEIVLVGNIFLLMKYVERINNTFFQFTEKYGDFLKQKAKVQNAEELSEDFTNEKLTNHTLPKNWKQINIRNLNFSYSSKEEDLNLNNVSLSIKKGEKIAFVGESGSGKTTLLKIIRDLYHPKNLDLRVDGKMVIGGFGSIARAISLIPQDPEVFATTIKENISLGMDHEESFIKRFTDMACFTDVVDTLPKGIDSSVKEKGVNLSGGQQQRLALSRGLLASSDKEIILLDEPTSSVDVSNEIKIYQNIFESFGEKTVISSIHRLHLLEMFDRIYFFKEGSIVGDGNLKELIKDCPEFLELWEKYKSVSVE